MECKCPLGWMWPTDDGYYICIQCKKTYKITKVEVEYNSRTRRIEKKEKNEMRTKEEIVEARKTMLNVFRTLNDDYSTVVISVLDWVLGDDNPTQEFLIRWRNNHPVTKT